MTYRLVIFDLDGTLADTWPWFVGALDEAAVRFGMDRLDASEREALRHCGTREILKRLGVPLWKVPAIARFMRGRKAEAGDAIALFPGVRRMLSSLVESGVALAIVSSDTERNVRSTLAPETAALINLFRCEAPLFGKAAHLRRVLKASGVPATQAIYIGDEVRDGEAARKAGLDFGAVTWGFAARAALRAQNPAAMFETLEDVSALLARR